MININLYLIIFVEKLQVPYYFLPVNLDRGFSLLQDGGCNNPYVSWLVPSFNERPFAARHLSTQVKNSENILYNIYILL